MIKEDPPFQKIPQACKTTGLSQYFLRNGCKNGTVPHIMSGTTYLVNVPALLKKLGVPSELDRDHVEERGGSRGKQ